MPSNNVNPLDLFASQSPVVLRPLSYTMDLSMLIMRCWNAKEGASTGFGIVLEGCVHMKLQWIDNLGPYRLSIHRSSTGGLGIQDELGEFEVTCEELKYLALQDIPEFYSNLPRSIGGRAKKLIPSELSSQQSAVVINRFFRDKSLFVTMRWASITHGVGIFMFHEGAIPFLGTEIGVCGMTKFEGGLLRCGPHRFEISESTNQETGRRIWVIKSEDDTFHVEATEVSCEANSSKK